MSKIDELFEKKLIDFTITPSPAVWDNIEARLSKKNKPVIWLRWAAVFLLGGLLLSVLWLKNETNELPLTEKSPAVVPEPEVNAEKPALASQQTKSKRTVSKKNNPAQGMKQLVAPIETVPQEQEVLEIATTEPVLIEKTVVVTKAKPIVLVYTLDAVETPEPQTTTVVAAEEKKEGLKKVMQFALDVKNGDSPLGIREMKDELFALDLKNKSTKKQH